MLRAYRRCLSVSSEVDIVCSSTIWYFVFIKFTFLFIFGEGLGSFICDILLISARGSFIRRFILNVQSPFLLLMFLFLMIHSFSTSAVLIAVIAAAQVSLFRLVPSIFSVSNGIASIISLTFSKDCSSFLIVFLPGFFKLNPLSKGVTMLSA